MMVKLCSVEKYIITEPLIQMRSLTKSLIKIVFFYFIIYCVTNAVAVKYSSNIPVVEKRSVCFQNKKLKDVSFNRYFDY